MPLAAPSSLACSADTHDSSVLKGRTSPPNTAEQHAISLQPSGILAEFNLSVTQHLALLLPIMTIRPAGSHALPGAADAAARPRAAQRSFACCCCCHCCTCVLQAHMLSQELLTLPQGPMPPNAALLAAAAAAAIAAHVSCRLTCSAGSC
jgi:hypothetical protein